MNKVRYYRNQKRMTQSELARIMGVQDQTIGNIERAKTKPRPSTLRKLAEALGVTVDQLFTDEEEEKTAA